MQGSSPDAPASWSGACRKMWGEENTSQLRKRWCSELRLSTRPSGLANAEPKTDRPPSDVPERATGAPEVKRTPGARRPGGARGPAAPAVGFPRAGDAERSADIILVRLRHFHGMLRGLPLKSLSSHEPTS